MARIKGRLSDNPMPLEGVRISGALGLFHAIAALAGGAGLLYYRLLPSPGEITLLVKAHVAIAVAAVFATWVYSYRRYRVADDTPQSRVRSAAQGYVELYGRARRLDPASRAGPIPGRTCAWWRCRLYERYADRIRFVRDDESGPFVLSDGTGDCVVDPAGAEFNLVWREVVTADAVYHATYIAEGETVYAVGELVTDSGPGDSAGRRAAARRVLDLWKQDPPSLLRRFDRDGSGQLDAGEWQAAIAAVTREAERNPATALPTEITHLRAPHDGRPFLISRTDPMEVLRKYRWLAPQAALAHAVWLWLFWGFFSRFLG